MSKRAVIYIRVSSELQGTKVSPQAQEEDCASYCDLHGYEIVALYKDIEKYRIGNRLVEPSGTRSDRPGLKQMLSDAVNNYFDVIIAWREDRLYRGIRPMIEVLDVIEQTDIEIELVKETFDRKMAPIKASIARMELEAKDERTKMGMFGRLSQGKAWANVPYGYQKNEDIIEEEPSEAEWVKKIWHWYAEGVSTREIRQQLIMSDAPQRKNRNLNKTGKFDIPWRLSVIYRILKNPSYYTGSQVIRWDGKAFEIPLPVLIDLDTAQRVANRKEKAKTHPVRHIKNRYLASGVVYCAHCGIKMLARTYRKRSNKKARKTAIGIYRCPNVTLGYREQGCVRSIGTASLDNYLWEKVWDLLEDDENFEVGIQSRINELKLENENSQKTLERLQYELDQVTMERQWVITQTRKGSITEEDMEFQLGALSFEESRLKKDLTDRSLLDSTSAEKFLEFVNNYRSQLRDAMKWVNSTPKTTYDLDQQFQVKREIVEALVKRVDVFPDKSIKVHFEIDLPKNDEIWFTTP